MRQTLGMVYMIVAVIGITISVLLIPTIWIGHAAAQQQVLSLVDQARQPLRQATDATSQVKDRLQSIGSTTDQLVSQAQGAAGGSGTIESQVAARLLGLLDQIAPDFLRLRTAYLNLRDGLTAAAQAAAVLQRLMPGLLGDVSLPTDQLSAIDDQLQSMDDTLRGMRADLVSGALPSNVPGVDALHQVQDGARQVRTGLDNVTARVDTLQTRMQQLSGQLDDAQSNALRILTLIALLLTGVCIYIGLLNAALFAYGRSLRRAVIPVVTVATNGHVVAMAEDTPAPAEDEPAPA